ncbi:hypothetical protein ARAM_001710 [Aspergillus rambellii]|uniref:Rhodopsin domain-containing protein n=1 Tax=Aspergillus rambellii TaxID=308745 RepID=A0A0F8URP9_9EURO|nr:hypothetical protein ARAM_001710 [Aspergillus rambellii]
MTVSVRGWEILAISWPLFSLCATLIALRIWVRIKVLRSYGWDDVFISLALMFAAGNTVLMTISIYYGTGQHASDLSKYQLIVSSKYNWLSHGFHVMSTTCGEISVAFFLSRIINKAKHHKPVIYIGIFLLTIVNLGCIFTMYGQCTPTARLWNQEVDGSCWKPEVQRDYEFFQGSFSAASDFVLAVYPLFMIWNLQMAVKVKVGLGIVLSLGFIVMIAAIVKTVHLALLSRQTDYPWNIVNLIIWITVEQYLIIIAACISTITPLFNITVRQRSAKRNTHMSHRGVQSRSRQSRRPHRYGTFTSITDDNHEYPPSGACLERGNHDCETPGPTILGSENNRGILMTTEINVETESGHGIVMQMLDEQRA